MKTHDLNFAFIDAQNLNLGIQELGWKLDYSRFRIYLKEKYGVIRAYIFIGYVPKLQNLYTALQQAGFILIFKPTIIDKFGNIKGNIDADMVLHAMIEYPAYAKAILVTSDGDFYSLAEYLYCKNKLKIVMSSHLNCCSFLLKKSAKEKIVYMDKLRQKLEYINKKHR